MLSNFVIGPEKFVLFIDNNNYGPISQKIITKLIGSNATTQQCPKVTAKPPPIDTRRILDIKKELSDLPDRSNVLLATATQLNLDYTIPDIVKLVHCLRLSTKCRQLFVWASLKNVSDPKLIPFLEHMADIVVLLKDPKHLSVLTKKSTGSVSRKNYQYEISSDYEVSVKERKAGDTKKAVAEPSIDPESLATFKINFDEDELAARNALKLPYERTSEEQQKPVDPQIHYDPDSDDDFDYEDPDEDLYI